jgi:hypothetical protein
MIYRSFLTRAYPTMKKNNPNTPIMLREAAGTLPKVYARYGAFFPYSPANLSPPLPMVEFPKEKAWLNTDIGYFVRRIRKGDEPFAGGIIRQAN